MSSWCKYINKSKWIDSSLRSVWDLSIKAMHSSSKYSFEKQEFNTESWFAGKNSFMAE